MTPELFAEVSRNLANHEGRRLSMYLDTKGIPTCGVGHALFAPVDACKAVWWKTTNMLATRDDVTAVYLGLKAKHRVPALMMTYEETQRLLQEDLARFERVTRSTFPELDSYPVSVQIALYDICFNCGSFTGWPKLTEAIKARRFEDAAKECHRKDVSEERNKNTFLQLSVA